MAHPKPGDIVLVPFPFSDSETRKGRPVLVYTKCPGRHDDYLLMQITSRPQQIVPSYGELLDASADDFAATGLSVTSWVRIPKLAVLNTAQIYGRLGQVSPSRLKSIRKKLRRWLS